MTDTKEILRNTDLKTMPTSNRKEFEANLRVKGKSKGHSYGCKI
jgi:hypothetical protein